MAIYDFPAMVALDGDGNPARNAIGAVYALADTSFTTPLSVTDLAGVTMASITSSYLGITPQFQVADNKVVRWKSGDYILTIASWQGIAADAEAAQAAAEAALADVPDEVAAAAAPIQAAAEAAQAAAEDAAAIAEAAGVALPAGGTVGDVLYRAAEEFTGEWGPAPTGGGGTTATWDTLSGKPPTFPPDSHTHTSAALSDATVVGRSVLTAADATAARAAIAAAPSTVVSFPGLSATDPTKAAPGGHAHTAATITYSPTGSITATNVQDAVAQAAALGGGSGTGSIRTYTYRSGAYPTLPTTKPGGVDLVLFLGPVQATSLPSWIGTGATQIPALQFYVATS